MADYVWPRLESLSPSEAAEVERRDTERLAAALELLEAGLAGEEDVGLAKAAADGAKVLLDAEREKRKGVEARLTTTLGFTAVASTLAVSVLGFRLSEDLYTNHKVVATVSVLLMAYLVLQLVRAGFAAVSGLGRASFDEPTISSYIEDLAPVPRYRRLARTYIECTSVHEKVNCSKVGQMALAHQAMRNFLAALLLLIAVAAFGGLAQIWGPVDVGSRAHVLAPAKVTTRRSPGLESARAGDVADSATVAEGSDVVRGEMPEHARQPAGGIAPRGSHEDPVPDAQPTGSSE